MIFMLCYSFGLTVLGPIGDKINRKYFLTGGYMMCSIAFMVFPAAYKIFGSTHI